MQQTPDLHPALNYTSPTDLTHIFLKAISLPVYTQIVFSQNKFIFLY